MTAPPIFSITQGTQLYRVLKKELDPDNHPLYEALDPNPFSHIRFRDGSDTRANYADNTPVEGRFGPFRKTAGKHTAVPLLYLTRTPETAYYEAMLRPLSQHSTRIISLKTLMPLYVARLSFNEDLHFADCRATFLEEGSTPFWKLSFNALFSSSQLKSIDCARGLAKHIYKTYPNLDGLVWDSVQTGMPSPVFILFGPKRRGKIETQIMALEDIATWKPYLMAEQKKGRVLADPDLITRI